MPGTLRAMTRLLAAGLVAAGTLLALLCYVLPAVRAGMEAAASGDLSSAVLGPREWRIFWRGCGLALAAATLAQAWGAGLAAGLLAVRRPRVRALTAWGTLVILLTPPYVYAYAWSLLVLPAGVFAAPALDNPWQTFLATRGRAVWCLAGWTAPLAAGVLLLGWQATVRPLSTLVRLDGVSWRLCREVYAPLMAPWLFVSLVTTFLVAATEYSVFHLCLVRVWNTEVLAAVQVAEAPGRALLLAWPLLGVAAAGVAVLWPLRSLLLRAAESLSVGDIPDPPNSMPLRIWAGPAAALLTLAVLLGVPAVLLGRGVGSVTAFADAWRIFPSAWGDGLIIALGATAMAACVAVVADAVASAPPFVLRGAARRLLRVLLTVVVVVAVGSALAPPALVGDAFAATYGNMTPIRDSRIVVVLVGVARYGIIAIALLALTGRVRNAGLLDMAAVDGARWSAAYLRVRLPRLLPAVAVGGMLVGLLTLGEVAASQLVVPPQVHSLAVTLLNMIHYGRQDEVVATVLYLLAFVGLGVGLLRLATRRLVT